MNILKITYGKIFFTFILFVVSLFFFFPINANVMCSIGETCPILTNLIRIADLNSTPSYVSINYWIILAYLIIEYIVVAAIITLSGRGGSVPFISKK